MKTTTIITALLLFWAGAIMAQPAGERQNVLQKKVSNTIMIDGREVPLIKKLKVGDGRTQQSLPRRAAYGVATTQVLLEEDFSNFTAGTPDQPDAVDITGGDRANIDPSMTQTPGWNGRWVYQAGGACYMEDPTRYSGAILNTPLGDYSGDITIKCRIKPVDEVTYAQRFVISVCRGGYDDAFAALTDNNTKIESELIVAYPGQWTEVEYTVRNYSADSDGFIQFSVYEKMLIDDIRITCKTSDFMAPPAIGSTEFNKDGFTVSWDPVERCGGYYIYLYKKQFTSEEERTFTADFEEGMPEGFSVVGNSEVESGVGLDGSDGLALETGDTLYTPYNFSRYKDMTCWAKLDAPDATPDELFNAQINVGVRTEDGSWISFGYFYADYYLDGAYLNFDEMSGGLFGRQYFGVSMWLSGLPEGSRLILDDIEIPAGRDAELVPTTVGQSAEYMNPYDFTREPMTTTYTFAGLDPYTEYHYAIQSHTADFFSDIIFHKAFGVAAPELDAETGVNADGYTVNWQPAATATGYRVRNYAIHTAESDGEYTVLSDDFSKVDASVTDATDPNDFETVDGTDSWTNIDEYTQQAGWDVQLLALAQGWLGAYATSGPGYLRTPLLDLSHDDEFYIELSAVGIPGYAFYVEIDGKYHYMLFENDGTISGKFTIPASADDQHVLLYSSAPFMLDYVKISQNVKKGDRIRLWHSEKEVGADETSCTVSGLSGTDCTQYGYTVAALRDEYPDYAESTPTSLVVVDLEAGTTGIGRAEAAEDIRVVARYSADGVKLAQPQPGLNILKMSDGTVRKVVVAE